MPDPARKWDAGSFAFLRETAHPVSMLFSGKLRLGFAVLAAVGCCLLFPIAAEAQLKTAKEVRSLSFEEAESGREVDLSGVVIFSDPPATVFIQDETAGTFFRLNGAEPPQPGDQVRVRGQTFPGLYLPGIETVGFEITGHPGLPDPRIVTHDDLMSGRYHYQRVSFQGVVRTVVPEEESLALLKVANGSQVVEVRVDQPVTDPEKWIDSEVLIEGLAAGRINARRQLVEPYLQCKDWSDLKLIQRGSSTDTATKYSPRELLVFDVQGQSGHRVKVQGTVLANFPGGETFLRDEGSAVRVKMVRYNPKLHAGDIVELIGFPEMEQFSAFLADAELVSRKLGEAQSEPIIISHSGLMNGEGDGDLVEIEGILRDRYRSGKKGVIIVQIEGGNLKVITPELPDEEARVGSVVRVIGICRVDTISGASYQSRPETVSLELRSADDLIVIRAPTWWTPRRLTTGLFVLLLFVGVAVLWIGLLKRQVNRQTRAIRERIEHEAALEERQRIAREFHDTLEQNLAGLSLRLDAATSRGTDEKLKGFLKGSRNLVSRIQTETRNLVSDLRNFSDEDASLKDALVELSGELWEQVRVEGSAVPDLPRRTVHHLKMIAQEAITNAVKHSGANQIDVQLSTEGNSLVMRIEDDGRGFDAGADTHGKVGHFGCMGMRERSVKLDAEIVWESEEGRGTSVIVKMPI